MSRMWRTTLAPEKRRKDGARTIVQLMKDTLMIDEAQRSVHERITGSHGMGRAGDNIVRISD